MYAFNIVRPKRIDDAVKELSDASESQILAGGQTLIPTMKQRLASPEKLVLLSGIDELKGLNKNGNILSIGAGTTHAEVAAQAGDYPALAALASHIGDPAVRNRGTIGGSLANNDPSADYPAAVLGSGATVKTNSREIAADDFFEGMFATALDEGEIITEIAFPIAKRANYQKFVQPASRFALVGVFVAQLDDGVRVAVTGASQDGVFRWNEAENALNEQFSADSVGDLLPNDEMISDLHGSAAYRAHLVNVLTKRAVEAA